MQSATLIRACEVEQTPRVLQLSGMFDLPPSKRAELTWDVHLDLPDEWNIGLIVGPSGCGKTTVARELFGDALISDWEWPETKSVLDGFPRDLPIREIVEMLSSVGFSSPPAWVRPFHTLSNGEQFRVQIARTLMERPALAVVDEFTSVVDRTVAQIGSAAVAKTIRRRNQRFVAVSCHYDIIEWLQPDWIYQPAGDQFQRRLLRRRPTLNLDIHPIDRSAWSQFKQYHYLSGSLSQSAHCFGGFLNGECIAFSAYIHFPHAVAKDIKMGHRLVVLPDYQGLGIGGKMDDWLGQYLWERGYRYRNVISHPAMIAYYNRSPRWKLGTPIAGSRVLFTVTKNKALAKKQLDPRRLGSMSFEYVPLERAKITN